MSLIDFVQKIQKKPRYVRIQVLWLSVFICMFFIVSVWVVSLNYSLSIDDNKDSDKKEINNDMLSLKDAFKASIGAFFEKEAQEEFEQTESQNGLNNQDEDINQIIESEKAKPAKLPLSR